MEEQFKILAVDDQKINLMLLADMLSDKNYHISLANSGASAIKHLEENTPDLILLDIVMPEMDGYEVCQNIKSSSYLQHIPIIFISADISSTSLRKAFELGAADFIIKPINIEEVLARISNQERIINSQKQQWRFIKQTEKMAELGQRVADITHEVANPIGNSNLSIDSIHHNIKMITQSLEAESLSKKSLEDYLAHMNESLIHCKNNNIQAFNLLSSLKDIAVGQSNHKVKEFNLFNLLKNIISTLKPQLKRLANPVEIKVDETLFINSYPGGLSQVINNLINNSLLHGFIDDKQSKEQISISATDDNEMINLVYRDNGVGMDEIELANALERFYTTRANKGGSGLGLSICEDIIKNDLLGHLSIETTKNEGITFYISLKKDLMSK